MYKLLIVDDEDLEREGMAQFIPWQDYDVELVGTAWNGQEGLQQIQEKRPDIVLTDIKMPVMNGVEMIRRTREVLPEVEFIVLSGYGEYEFTSQVMAEGVRHYVLKPCAEDKITPVLQKVIQEIEERKEQSGREKHYQNVVRRLLPRAKEQLFGNMLLGREQMQADYQMFLDEIGEEDKNVAILAFRKSRDFDHLEQFVLENILAELLGENRILLTTAIRKDVLFLMEEQHMDGMDQIIQQVKTEFFKFEPIHLQTAVSKTGKLEQVNTLYMQIQELFQGIYYDTANLVDYKKLAEAVSFEEILFELYLIWMKMELEQYDFEKKQKIFNLILKLLPETAEASLEGDFQEPWQMVEAMAEILNKGQKTAVEADKEEKEELRFRKMLLEVYRNLQKQEMNIQYLSKEVLYMNEDHFGRVFLKHSGEKFSSYLLRTRIILAQRLLEYNPELKTTRLAELTGYPPDGQYFTKAFRKITGMSTSEYRSTLPK